MPAVQRAAGIISERILSFTSSTASCTRYKTPFVGAATVPIVTHLRMTIPAVSILRITIMA